MKNRETILRAIVFDCDGIIVDSEPAHFLAWRHSLLLQGHNLSLEEYCLHAGNPTQTILKCLAQKAGMDRSDDILREKRAFYHQLQSNGLPPIQPVIDFIRQLSCEKEKLKLKLGVASSARKEGILSNLRHLHVDELFDIVVSGQDDLKAYEDPEGVNKPKPYIYLHLATTLNFSPSECIAIEDSATGVTAAKNAGFLTVAVPNKITQSQDLSHADIVLPTLADLSPTRFFQILKQLK